MTYFRLNITNQELSFEGADISGGAALPSNFPFSGVLPFQLPSVTTNFTFIAVINFRYPSGVSSDSDVLPLGPTLEAVRLAADNFVTVTPGLVVLFVNGIDLTFLYQNRLIIYITAPIAALLLCGCLLGVIIGM